MVGRARAAQEGERSSGNLRVNVPWSIVGTATSLQMLWIWPNRKHHDLGWGPYCQLAASQVYRRPTHAARIERKRRAATYIALHNPPSSAGLIATPRMAPPSIPVAMLSEEYQPTSSALYILDLCPQPGPVYLTITTQQVLQVARQVPGRSLVQVRVCGQGCFPRARFGSHFSFCFRLDL